MGSPARLTAARRARLEQSRVGLTEQLVDAMAAAGMQRSVLVSGSAVGYYGDRGDEVLDESSPPGRGFMPEVCQAWEDAARPAAARARVVTLRTGLVLSLEGGALPPMVLPFRLFAGGPLGSGRHYQPCLHLADDVALVLLALDDARVSGPLNCAGPEPLRNRDVARILGRLLGRPSFLPAPAFAIRAALGEAAEVVLSSQRVVPKRALDLGFRFRYPTIETALTDLLTPAAGTPEPT